MIKVKCSTAKGSEARIGNRQGLIFLPEFDPELKDFNLKMANDIETEGGKVLYIKVKQLSPKVTSRLIGVEVGAN